MRRVLFSVGPYHVLSYGPFTALGYAAGLLYLGSQRTRMDLSREGLWNFFLCLVVGALIGGKLGWLLFYFPGPVSEWPGALVRLTGGLSFYQGFWTSVLFGLAYCLRTGKDFSRVADFVGVAAPLGHAIGRVGCFLNGCCYGRPTDLPWGLVFTDPLSRVPSALRGIPLHPTQLYEALGEGALALFLHVVLVRRTLRGRLRSGTVFWGYVLGYGVLRLGLDAFRAVPPGWLSWHLTTAQWFAVLSSVTALGFLARRGAVLGRTSPARPTAT